MKTQDQKFYEVREVEGPRNVLGLTYACLEKRIPISSEEVDILLDFAKRHNNYEGQGWWKNQYPGKWKFRYLNGYYRITEEPHGYYLERLN